MLRGALTLWALESGAELCPGGQSSAWWGHQARESQAEATALHAMVRAGAC